MKSSSLSWLWLLGLILAAQTRATVYYWDPEGTAAETAANLAGTWNTSAEWSTAYTQTATPAAWSPGVAACFSAGVTTVTAPFTVVVNSPMSIAGIFNGTLANNPGVFLTLSGSGSLNLVAGADAFATGGSDGGTTTISVPLTGAGQVALEGSAQIYFNAANTYSGGTSLGYAGVTAFTSIVNFNNGRAFGTGPLQMNANGAGSQMAVEGAAAVTITNALVAANVNFNIVGNAAGLTFSGPWTLGTTPVIGTSGSGNLVIISGVMSGAGGFTKYNPGTLVFSGANTFSGPTTVSNGVLSITADNNLGAAPGVANYDLTLSGGTLNASNTFTLNPNRLILLAANSAIGVSSGNTLTYAGGISGSAALAKSGAGTLALGGVSSFTGATTISSGTLEADSQTGSATGTNQVNVPAGATLSGSGIVGGPVSGAGNVAPGTSAGAATLTLGNGLNLSSGGAYVWNLSSNSVSGGVPSISLIGGNLKLGGASKLSVNFTKGAGAPATNNPFWLTQEAWTVVSVNGSAANPNNTQFASVLNGSYPAGNFTNFVSGNGNIVLLYQPNFAVLDALYDAGPGFFGGENLVLTNFSGLALYVWSATNASLSVSNWTLVGPLAEQSLGSGYSRYAINVNPTVSPTFYVAGNLNTGTYVNSPVPATVLTTPDFSDFTVINTNVSISANGVLALLPPPPVILPGGSYAGGDFQFQFSGATNQNFIIQVSTDLVNWSDLAAGAISSSPMTFTDSSATNYAQEFYRVFLPGYASPEP